MRQGPTSVASKRCQRHEPETTPLYKIVAEHIETFLAVARETHERALPQYVERELREYLKCGILAHGFLRARCRSCGKDLLVALSCKKRGVCPSCNARRMCGTAAHLTDTWFLKCRCGSGSSRCRLSCACCLPAIRAL